MQQTESMLVPISPEKNENCIPIISSNIFTNIHIISLHVRRERERWERKNLRSRRRSLCASFLWMNSKHILHTHIIHHIDYWVWRLYSTFHLWTWAAYFDRREIDHNLCERNYEIFPNCWYIPLIHIMFNIIQPQSHLNRIAFATPMINIFHFAFLFFVLRLWSRIVWETITRSN